MNDSKNHPGIYIPVERSRKIWWPDLLAAVFGVGCLIVLLLLMIEIG